MTITGKSKLNYEARLKNRLKTLRIEKVYNWNFLITSNFVKNNEKSLHFSFGLSGI